MEASQDHKMAQSVPEPNHTGSSISDDSLSGRNEESAPTEVFGERPSDTSGLRRRRRKDRSGGRGKKGKGAPGRRDRINRQKLFGRVIFAASLAVLLIGALFLGFVVGQKNEKERQSMEKKPKSEAPDASPESQVLMEKAFRELAEGNSKEAMIDFQKIQNLQPSFHGIDFLIGKASLSSGELVLAEQALLRAVDRDESADQARVLLAIIQLNKAKSAENGSFQMTDPVASAESDFRHYASMNPSDASIYGIWGEMMKAHGSYRSAAELMHKGVLRAEPQGDGSFLAAKEMLSLVQDEPSKAPPSLSEIPTLSADQSLGAALCALRQHKTNDALLFLERARDLYSPRIFRELMKDSALDEFRKDPQVKQFFQKSDKESPAHAP